MDFQTLAVVRGKNPEDPIHPFWNWWQAIRLVIQSFSGRGHGVRPRTFITMQ